MASSTLTTIQIQLNLYAHPIFMILGNIGNIFIIIILNRQRQSACAIYLVTSTMMNILYLTINAFMSVFPYNPADGTIRAIILCKFFAYIPNILGHISKTTLILACIDRFLITDRRATFRAFRIMTTIINRQCTRNGIYLIFFTIYVILFVGLIPWILLTVFGYLTYRIQPAGRNLNNTNVSMRRRDRDLLILVISEVLIYVLTISLFPVILLEMMISQYVILNKSSLYIQAEGFIFNIALLLLSINSAVPFYIFLISSKSFCEDFKQLITNNYRKFTGQPTIQIIRRKDQTLTQRDTPV